MPAVGHPARIDGGRDDNPSDDGLVESRFFRIKPWPRRAERACLMTVTLKTPEDIEKMRIAGRLAADVLEMIGDYVKPGVTTEELDRICHDYIVNEQKAIPAPLNYKGFPKSICTSINHVVCHGIPNEKPLKNGDVLNIDVTVIKDGYHGDTSKMFHVGKVPEWAERLSRVTQECLYKGIEVVKPGAHLGDIGEVIQKHAEKNGFSVVREYCGHGIGRVFHEEPQVLHYGEAGDGMELKEGMTFTIEPMINQGKADTRLLGDGWTAITKDRKLSAQWEHTILVTATGYEIFTLRSDDTIARTSV
jgi:methionyl aminopeptidase